MPGNAWSRLGWFRNRDLTGGRRQVDDFTDSPDNTTRIGRMLAAENVLSLAARYPGDYDAMVGYSAEEYEWKRLPFGDVPTAVQGLCLLNCYEYQSCEHDEWRMSEAYQFCDALRHALIHFLPGYQAAPWGWPVERSSRLHLVRP